MARLEFSSRRVLSRVPAASTTTRAFTLISRRESRSTKLQPLGRPVFLSTVISRTTALAMDVSLPVFSASGSSRLTELAEPSRPCAERCLQTVMPRGLADVNDALHCGGPRGVVEDEVAIRHLRRPFQRAGDAEDSFDARVVGSEIGVADGPVFAEAVA